MSAAVSLAALGYALLISSITRTTEQASLLGGAGNLILAAIGGIMVPKFVMPEAMQHLTNVSPMAWGLEGFLDVLLRDWRHGRSLARSGRAQLLWRRHTRDRVVGSRASARRIDRRCPKSMN